MPVIVPVSRQQPGLLPRRSPPVRQATAWRVLTRFSPQAGSCPRMSQCVLIYRSQ